MDADPDFLARLKAFEGLTAAPPRPADDPVNEPMIRHWCQALSDANPVYWDPAFAAGSVHGGIVAPPTMLQSWTHHDRRFAGDPSPDEAEERLVRLLAEHGFESVVASNCDQEYVRYLRPGDRLTYHSVIETVSEQKRTALGVGHFITTLVTYTDQHDEAVARMRFRTYRFRPHPRPDATSER